MIQMKKKNIILVSILAILLIAGYFYFSKKNDKQQVNIVTTKVYYGDISSSITATGTIKPIDTVSVGSQISGVVRNIYADFNDVVKKGQLLAKVDPSIIGAQVEATKANLFSAKSNLEYQQSTFDRQEQLFKLGAISKADFQVALNQRNTAKATVDNANALLIIAKKNLFYTNIYTPIDGTVINRNVREGQTIAASLNAPTLFVIANDLTKMQVRAAVDEADIGNVKAGQNVSFTVDAFPDNVFKGIVYEILLNSKTTANVVTYTTLINVDNKDMRLKPGMTANINIYTEEDKNVMIIPLRALTFKPDSTQLKNYTIQRFQKNMGTSINKHHQTEKFTPSNPISSEITKSYVWIKNGNTITEKQITTGIIDDTNVRVIDGLSINDELITNVLAEATGSETKAEQSPFIPKMSQKPTNTSKKQ